MQACIQSWHLNGSLLGPTQRRGLAVEDDVGGLEGNITKDVDANVGRGLETAVALAKSEGFLSRGTG